MSRREFKHHDTFADLLVLEVFEQSDAALSFQVNPMKHPPPPDVLREEREGLWRYYFCHWNT
jgi:hypothetical protein